MGQQTETTTVVVAPTPKAPLVGGGRIAAIVPQDIDSAYRLATLVVKSGMAPKSLDTVEKATVAIMHGLEVGFTPMAALQSIAVVNGMPTIYGDGMIALVRGSGLMEDIIETIEDDQEGPTIAVCKVKRKGQPTWVVQSFTRPQAMRAGLWKKTGPWTQYPQRMMQMRARSWALRDAFPDVLRGLNSAEEAIDMVDITSAGRATTTPAEPRRSDYVHVESAEAQQTESDQPAHDAEIGEIKDGVRDAAAQALAPINDADWRIDESLMGLERKVEDFGKKADAASNRAEVDAVERVNADFIEKLGAAYRKRTDEMLKRRREEIAKAGAR